jgi:hypothetical protein
MNNTNIGNISSYKFDLKIKQNTNCYLSWPEEGAPFDRIVSNLFKNIRVQLKSTKNINTKNRIKPRYSFDITRLKNGKRLPYSKEDCDYIAVLIITIDVWYIIPIEELKTFSGFSICPDSNTSKYSKYKEAWFLFE